MEIYYYKALYKTNPLTLRQKPIYSNVIIIVVITTLFHIILFQKDNI